MVVASLGTRDAAYIRSIIKTQRLLELGGRGTLLLGANPVAWVAKILENMEIGHNVMHGQWDWTRDPDIDSHDWDWDFVCTGRRLAHTRTTTSTTRTPTSWARTATWATACCG
jgi:fatty acid desaturase